MSGQYVSFISTRRFRLPIDAEPSLVPTTTEEWELPLQPRRDNSELLANRVAFANSRDDMLAQAMARADTVKRRVDEAARAVLGDAFGGLEPRTTFDASSGRCVVALCVTVLPVRPAEELYQRYVSFLDRWVALRVDAGDGIDLDVTFA